ncbi:MAG TPA: penicillin-binding protein 2 [Chloroflexia bacterium]|nr:penicillin-binding protein 2 [Chloroflexia bacterium]
MKEVKIKGSKVRSGKVSRRTFLRASGLTVIAAGMGSVLVACGEDAVTPTSAPSSTSSAPIVPGFVSGTNSPAAANTTSAATKGNIANAVGVASSPTANSSTPIVVKQTNPTEAASAFLKAWEERRYADMYDMLSANAKNFIAKDKFVERYGAIADEATISTISTSVSPPGDTIKGQLLLEVPFKANFKTVRVGDFSQDNKLNLQSDNGDWKVEWSPAAIFKELDNSTYLVHMIRLNSDRGQIIARNNQPLTQDVSLFQIYVVPGQIENEDELLNTMSQALKMDKDKIKNLYKNGQPNWRMPIKDLPANTPPDVLDSLRAIKGVGVDEGKTRGYPQKESASQVVGYINAINADDLKTLAAKGYTEDDKIGRVGVEAWGEDILAGGFGGKLTIIQSDGSVLATLAEKPAVPSSNLILNLDLDIQKKAEAALAGRTGSIVVMDPNNGAVLALANFPGYDPNLFANGITADQFNALNNDPRHPFQNRAVNGNLPTGSTFKAVTTAAALEKGGFNMQSTFVCTGHWTGLGEQFAKDCYLKTGHGKITLFEALVQSCDFVYYELGKRLDEIDSSILPTMARAFGFGSSTGLQGLYDSPGQVPDPQWKQDKLQQAWFRGDAVNLAIGQGYFLASPLQLATAYSAIANGGNLVTPRLAERAESPNGQPTKNFAPQVRGRLPVSDGTLNQIRQALLGVTQEGLGTARQAFAGSRVKVSGKTGTAESGKDQPHAWFACYAPSDKPKYVVVVCLENIGFGNALAAPTARKVMDGLPF